MTIYGGTVTATGYQGAGIGGGSSSSVDTNVNVIDSSCGNGGTVTIYGGTVNASGTNGAGIGGGSAATGYYAGQQYYVGGGGTITINGGTVNATGTSGGIGAGPNCGSRDFTNKVTPKGTLKGTSIGLITGTLVPSLNTSSFTGLIKNGGTYTVYGNLSLDTLETPLSISEGENLSINGSLNIPVGKTVTVTNAGTIDCGSGKFVNNGTLYLDNSSTVNGTFGGSGVFLISVDLPDDTNDLTAFPDTFTYTGEDFAGQIFLGTGGTQELGGKTFWETVRTDGWTITYAKDGQSTETVIDAGEYTATFTPPEGETITRTFTVKRAAQTISAPEIQSQSEGAVTLKPVTGVVGKVEYGYSTTNDAASIDNWQESPTFNDMTYGTYYFFAKVTGDSNHEDAVSSTGTVVAFREISSISITSNPTKMLYTPGATLDLTGLKITVTYTDNSTAEVTWTADSGITTSIPNGTSLTASHDGQTITITYGGKTAVTDSLLIYDEVPQQIDGVYQIGTVKELIWFAALVNGTLTDGTEQNTAANAVLTADIDLGGRLWAPIASSTTFRSGSFSVNGTTNTSYSGIFDGQGHIISNFKIRTNSDELTSGLFGAVTGTIENLGIVNASFDNGGAYDGRFGALCGLLVKDRFTKTAATIQNCYVVGSSIKASGRIAGAVCGANYGGTIEDCYECGNTVTAHNRIGHLVGDNHNDYDYNPMTGTVTNCYSDTKLAGTQGGTVNGGGVKDAEEFASGEVAYLLNGSTSENVIWYQNVDIGTKDNYPVLDSTHGIVYCIDEDTYSNNPDATTEPTDISSATVTLDKNSFTYDGSEQKPTVTVKLGGKTLTADTHYTVTYSGDGINVGSYSVTVAGDGTYYTGTADEKPSYTIAQATVTPSISGNTTKTYDGTTAATGLTITLNGVVSDDSVTAVAASYTYDSANASESKTVTASNITLSGEDAGNYTLSATSAQTTGTITTADLTVTADNQTKTYGDTDPELTYTATGLKGDDTLTGALERNAGEDVGSYAITQGSLAAGSNYTLTFTGANLTITARPVTLSWSTPTSFTYDGSEHSVTAQVSNAVNGDTFTLTYENNAKTDVGNYTAKVTGLGNTNYTLTGATGVELTWSIGGASIAGATVELNQNSFTYNGSEQKPTVTVKLGGKTLTEGSDYDVTYNGNCIDAGTYTVTVTGKGSYTGEATNKPSYTINKATPTLTWSEGSQTLPYTGSPADITAPTVNLVNNETYSGTISYQYKASGESEYTDGLPTDVGTYTVMASIAAQGNYTEATSGELTLTIEGAAATGTVTAVENLTYNGQAQNLVTAGAVTGGEIQYSLTGGDYYTDTIPTGTDAKTYTVWYKVVGDENHSDSAPTSVNVTIAKLPVELTWSNTDFTYDGSAKCPTATVSNKANDTDEVNVTVSGGQTNASDTAYTATATDLTGAAAGNYTLTGCQNTSQEFTIAKADSNVNAPTNLTATYGSTLNDVTLPDGWAWDDAVTTSVGNVGNNTFSATYTPSDTTNYNTVNEDLTVTVSAKNITGADITLGGSLTYTGQQQTQQIASVTVDNMTVTYTVSGNTGTDAGDYTLTITGTGNFTGEATQKWSIAKATYTGTTGVSGTVLANYSGEVTLPDIPAGASYGTPTSSDVTSLSITDGVLHYTGGSGIVKGQTYTVTVPVNGGKNYNNYEITVTLTGTDKQVLNITGITAQDGTYNGQAQTGYTGSPAADGYDGDFTVTYSTADGKAPTNAGTYTVTIAIPEDDAQYVGSTDLQFTIAQKPLTVSVPSPSVYVGDSAPELVLTYTGLVDGERVTPSEAPVFTITNDGTEITLEDAVKTAGTYTITWSNAGDTTFTGDANYAIQTVTAGTLTVSVRSSGGTTTYPVQVEENSQNGGVQVSPKNAVPGTLVTVAPQPAPGYELATLSVLDQYGNEVDVNPLGNGNYSFKMPRSGVKVEATFYCTGSELCPTHHLADVLVKAWYHDAVDYVVEHGIMTGSSATTFDPNGTLSRAMVAQILYNLEGQPTVTGESTFTDVSGHWAIDAITWAQKTGVVDGYEDNTFRPENNVTRQEFAQMMYNYAAYKDYDLSAKGDLSQFTDGDSVQEWAVTAMSWANGNALINGHDDGTLEPGGTTTRAQAASILMRFDQNLVEN